MGVCRPERSSAGVPGPIIWGLETLFGSFRESWISKISPLLPGVSVEGTQIFSNEPAAITSQALLANRS